MKNSALGSGFIVDITLSLSSAMIILDIFSMSHPHSEFHTYFGTGISVGVCTSLLLYLVIDHSFRLSERRKEQRELEKFGAFSDSDRRQFVRGFLFGYKDQLVEAVTKALSDRRVGRVEKFRSRALGASLPIASEMARDLRAWVSSFRHEEITRSFEELVLLLQGNAIRANAPSPDAVRDWVSGVSLAFVKLERLLEDGAGPEGGDGFGLSVDEVGAINDLVNEFNVRAGLT